MFYMQQKSCWKAFAKVVKIVAKWFISDDLNPSRLNDCVQSVSIAVSHHFPENPGEILHEGFLARLSRFPVAVHHLSRVFGSKATHRSEVWVVSPNSCALPLPFPVSKVIKVKQCRFIRGL